MCICDGVVLEYKCLVGVLLTYCLEYRCVLCSIWSCSSRGSQAVYDHVYLAHVCLDGLDNLLLDLD